MTQIQAPAPAALHAWSLFMHRMQVAETALHFVAKQWQCFREWRQRRVTIAQLLALDDAVLKDIGLHRSQIDSLVFNDGRRVQGRR